MPDGFGEGVGHVARGDEGLIIQEGEEYRLNDVYVAMELRARKKINEKINEKIKLTDRQKMVIDYILNNQHCKCTYLSVTKKEGVSQTYDTPSSLYKSLSISKVIHIYIYYVYRSVLFLLAQANRMAHVSHFWN